MRGYFGQSMTLAAALAVTTTLVQAADVEVLHWWTSGGEAAALNVLNDNLKAQDIGWVDGAWARCPGGDQERCL